VGCGFSRLLGFEKMREIRWMEEKVDKARHTAWLKDKGAHLAKANERMVFLGQRE